MPKEPIPQDLKQALSDLHETEAAQLSDVWLSLGSAAAPADSFPSETEALRQLERRIGRGETTARRDRPARRHSSRRRLVVGVLSAFLLVAALSVWLWYQPVLVTSAPGEVAHYTLPDGSTLVLAPDSEARFTRGFRSFPFRPAPSRAVSLQGEGFFEVVQSDRPFVVETHNARVEVVGTAFNVRARVGDASDETRVTVESGSVRVSARGRDDIGAVLEAGQVGEMSASAPAPIISDFREPVASWRDDGFAIHALPLGDVLREIERRFGLVIRGAADLPYETPLTLYYSRVVDAEIVLRDVAIATDLEYRPIRGGYEVLRPRSSRQ